MTYRAYNILGVFLICSFLLAASVEAIGIHPAPASEPNFFAKLFDSTIGAVYKNIIVPIVDAIIGPEGFLNGKAPDPATYQIVMPGQTARDENGDSITDVNGIPLENKGSAPAVVTKVNRDSGGAITNAQLWPITSSGGQLVYQNMLVNAEARQEGIIFYSSKYEQMVPREITPSALALAVGSNFLSLPFGTTIIAKELYNAIMGDEVSAPEITNPFTPSAISSLFPDESYVIFPDGNGGESRISLSASGAQDILYNNPTTSTLFVPAGTTSQPITFSDIQLSGQLAAGSTIYYVTAGSTDSQGNTQFFVNSYRNEPVEYYNFVNPLAGYIPPPCSSICGNGIKECSEQCELNMDSLSFENSADCPQSNSPNYGEDDGHLSQSRDGFGNCNPSIGCKCEPDTYSAPACTPDVRGAQCTPSENLGTSNLRCTGANAGKICGNDCTCGSLCGNGVLDGGEQCEIARDCKLLNGNTDDTKKCSGCLCVAKTNCGDGIVQNPNDYGQPEACEPKTINQGIVSQLLGEGSSDYKIQEQPLFYVYNKNGNYESPDGPRGQCTVGCLSCIDGCLLDRSFESVGPNPTGEICGNGWDDNCNDEVDEGESCTCTPGETKACGASPGMLQNIGACQSGSMICEKDVDLAGKFLNSGHWGNCLGGFWPRLETSNGIDDNCNGIVDDCVLADITSTEITTTNNNLVHRGIYFVNVPINFNVEQLISGTSKIIPPPEPTWEILEEPSFTNKAENFKHTFTTTGQKTITLTLRDSNNKIVDEYQIAILVVDNSAGMLAFINKPFHKQIVSIDTITNQDSSVEYSASDSYAISVSTTGSSCAPSITCLAGNCPEKSKTPPLNCGEVINVVGGNKGFSAFNFDWEFVDLQGQDVSGLGQVSGSVNYYKSSGNKVINLLLNYDNSGVNMQKEFRREFTIIRNGCSFDGGTFYEFDANGRVTASFNTQTTADKCKGVDNTKGTSDDCCPSGNLCGISPENPAVTKCIPSNKVSCAEFSGSKTECEEQGSNLVTNINDVLEPANAVLQHKCWKPYSEDSCRYDVKCSCVWNDAEIDDNKKCKFNIVRVL